MSGFIKFPPRPTCIPLRLSHRVPREDRGSIHPENPDSDSNNARCIMAPLHFHVSPGQTRTAMTIRPTPRTPSTQQAERFTPPPHVVIRGGIQPRDFDAGVCDRSIRNLRPSILRVLLVTVVVVRDGGPPRAAGRGPSHGEAGLRVLDHRRDAGRQWRFVYVGHGDGHRLGDLFAGRVGGGHRNRVGRLRFVVQRGLGLYLAAGGNDGE